MAIDAAVSRKTIFLRAANAITTVMHSMTSEDAKEQKAACGRKKKVQLTPVKKQYLGGGPSTAPKSPSLTLPKGRESQSTPD